MPGAIPLIATVGAAPVGFVRIELRRPVEGGSLIAVAFLGQPRGSVAGAVAIESRPPSMADLAQMALAARVMWRKHAIMGLEVAGAARLSVFRAPHLGAVEAEARAEIAAMIAALGVDAAIPDGLADPVASVRLRAPAPPNLDPSRATAVGMFAALMWLDQHARPQSHAPLARVAVQGLGRLGGIVAELALAAGLRVFVAETATDELDAFLRRNYANRERIDVIASKDFVSSPVDALLPCATGGVIGSTNADRISAWCIVPGATGTLSAASDSEESELASRLKARGILFLPEWVAAAGGVLAVAAPATATNGDALIERICARIKGHLAGLKSSHERGGSWLSASRIQLDTGKEA